MTKADRPNILLVTTDQQRFDTIGSRAPAFLRTPHLQQLAREGTSFACAYSDNPLCVPSRASIMSGQSVWSHGMVNNGTTSDVLGQRGTLPDLLHEVGYQTYAIGKMHFGPERARHGFDEIVLPADYYREMTRRGLPVAPMRHGLGQNELYPGMSTVPEPLTLTSWLCEQAVLFLRERRDPLRPFFLWLSFSKPHPPLDPPEPYYSMYRSSDLPEPVVGDWAGDDRSPAAIRRQRLKDSYDLIPREVYREARSAYYGLITQVDYNLGRVFAALQDHDELNETAVLFTSDHGEFLGDHRLGNKVLFHEPSAHVPFILRLPHSDGRLPRGSENQLPVSHRDILPTLLSIAGAPEPPDVDGTDIVARAQDPASQLRYVTGMSAGADAGNETPLYFAVTDGRWKYIWYPEGGREQLFCLEEDPQELADLAGRAGEGSREKARLRAALIADMSTSGGRKYLVQGDLPAWPEPSESTEELRTTSWPGYHTENYHLDVRH
jgi:arylsulfatase